MKIFIKWLIKLLLWYSIDLLLFSFIGLKILELNIKLISPKNQKEN